MSANALNKGIGPDQHVLLRELFKGNEVKGLTRQTVEAAIELSRRVIADSGATASEIATHSARIQHLLRVLNGF
jgi:hypothetical protein